MINLASVYIHVITIIIVGHNVIVNYLWEILKTIHGCKFKLVNNKQTFKIHYYKSQSN